MEQAITPTPVAETERLGGLDFRKLGMWLFLGSEVIFFSAPIIAFLRLRIHYASEINHVVLNIPLTAVNTFILIVSSTTLVLGLSAIQRGNQRGLRIGLALTTILGAVFLSLQATEWLSLFGEGFAPGKQVFATYFFTMTGFHGLHVLVGVIWSLIVLTRVFGGRVTKDNYLAVEMFGLYWHFVDLVWIILFTILYLI